MEAKFPQGNSGSFFPRTWHSCFVNEWGNMVPWTQGMGIKSWRAWCHLRNLPIHLLDFALCWLPASALWLCPWALFFSSLFIFFFFFSFAPVSLCKPSCSGRRGRKAGRRKVEGKHGRGLQFTFPRSYEWILHIQKLLWRKSGLLGQQRQKLVEKKKLTH